MRHPSAPNSDRQNLGVQPASHLLYSYSTEYIELKTGKYRRLVAFYCLSLNGPANNAFIAH